MERKEIAELINELQKEYPESKTVMDLIKKFNDVTDKELRRKTMGYTRESLKEHIVSNIKREGHVSNVSDRKMLNSYFEYGINGETVHIHLPKDLHQEFNELGKRKAIAQVGIYLIDAINKINAKRELGDQELAYCKTIYMISPIFYSGGFYPKKLRKRYTNEISIESPVLKVLEMLGIETRTITARDLQNRNKTPDDSEVQLAYKHFGDKKDIGSASLSFEELNSKEWQRKLRVFDKICKKQVYGKQYKNAPEIE